VYEEWRLQTKYGQMEYLDTDNSGGDANQWEHDSSIK
jgi:hypothetical protein